MANENISAEPYFFVVHPRLIEEMAAQVGIPLDEVSMSFLPISTAAWARYMGMTEADILQTIEMLGLNRIPEVLQLQNAVTEVSRLSIIRAEAKTLREKVFCRMMTSLRKREVGHWEIQFNKPGSHTFVITPKKVNLRGVMAACKRNDACRRALSGTPFSQAGTGILDANRELVAALQDLGDLIAKEANDAATAEWYPGVSSMEWISDEHVDAVMAAMQREMDREGTSRSRLPVVYAGLSRERQRALAERRRMWFGKYGITPKNWKRGIFSIWKVSNELPPDWLEAKKKVVEDDL